MNPRPFLRRALLLSALLGCGATVTACAPAIRSSGEQAARGATSGVAEESLKQLEDPQLRARVAAVLETPEMQRAMKELAGGLSQGVVEGLSSDELAQRIDTLVARFTKAVFAAIGQGVGQGVDAATSPESQAKIGRFVGAVVASAMRGAAAEIPRSVTPALQKALSDTVGPLGTGMRDLVRKDVAPAMAELLKSPEFKAALGEAARTVAHDGVVGSNQALAELTEQRKKDQGGSPLGGLFAPFATRTWLLALLAAAIVLGLPLLWLGHEYRQARRYRADAERRSARADALLRAIEVGGERGFSPSMLALLREQLLSDQAVEREEREEREERVRPSRPRLSHA